MTCHSSLINANSEKKKWIPLAIALDHDNLASPAAHDKKELIFPQLSTPNPSIIFILVVTPLVWAVILYTL